ncbi:MAG: hypothetical protein ACXW0F_13160 [Gaiellaceae bacterium]
MSTGAYADTSIGTTTRPTPIRSWAGVAAFSIYDQRASGYRLAVSRQGGPPEILPVAAQATAFDLDVGPNTAGSPAIVYSRCASAGTRLRGCDLYRYSLSAGRESKLVGPSTRNASETAPTIWGGRVAWARVPDAHPTRVPRIYTRTLSARRSRRSRQLASIPSHFCRGGGCAIEELELRERRLAVNAGYPGPVCNNGQIRLDSIGGRSLRIADTTCGLNGQSFVGVSLDARNLYFARYCVAAPVSCGRDRSGAFRYSLTSGRYSLARFGRRLTGFSYTSGGRAYEVLAPDTSNGYCGNSIEDAPPPDCQIVLTDPLVFAPDRALR